MYLSCPTHAGVLLPKQKAKLWLVWGSGPGRKQHKSVVRCAASQSLNCLQQVTFGAGCNHLDPNLDTYSELLQFRVVRQTFPFLDRPMLAYSPFHCI